MSMVVSQTGPGGRVGELALWGVAGLVMLTMHCGAALYLMREEPISPAENAPPAAIMIELAPEPVAANTEEEQVSPDVQDVEEVRSEQAEPIEEPQPEPIEQPQPEPEPTPEPVVEPQPQPVEPPPQEVAEPIEPEPEPVEQVMEEPPPEPIEEIDPIEEQMTAALENVEVPLPMMRPPPPAEKPPEEAKKPNPKKEPVKKVQKPKQQQQQARREMAEARVQTTQSDRTAATQTSTGSVAPSVSPAKWKSRVQAKLARTARKCPGNSTGTAAVRFSFDGGGNVTNVSLSRSSGDSAIDNYIVAAVRRASPIPAPPSGVASYLDQALTCQ